MFNKILTKVFGTKSGRDLKKSVPVLEQTNDFYLSYHTLSDHALRRKTEELRQALSDGAPVDDVFPEAAATVKELSRRLVGKTWPVCDIDTHWNMVPFDVQLQGAMVLHEGKIAEMATGEGKTLAATIPLYLNGVTGKGAHLVTVNDYLARRDSEWMGKIYEHLGLVVGCIQHDIEPQQRKTAYRADVTYGTNNEFGFDYLRDNMATSLEGRVQRGHHYAIVDEVDSILIDEARTPLIISGPVSVSRHKFESLKPAVEKLAKEQIRLVNDMLADAEKMLDTDDEYTAGINMLAARRGAPKHRKLFKLMQDGNLRRLVDRVERDYMREKRLHDIDEQLYFAIDERGHSVDLSEKGRLYLEKGSKPGRSTGSRSSDRPDIRLIAGDGGLDFSPKTKQILAEEQTLDYLAEKTYPLVVAADSGHDSLFLLPDSALAFQRIDSDAGGLLRSVLLEEARPQGPDKVEDGRMETFLENWIELNSGFLSLVQVRLRQRFEDDYGERSGRLHNISQLLKAYSLFDKDVDYVVKEDKVLIVDQFTGRLMPGRRYSDGLHQALEAKEGVTVERETQTLATITIQNYFRLYEKLAGMTGTAETEAGEFYEIYKLDVVVVPTNEPVRRADYEDVIYLTRREKYAAIIDEIVRMHEMGRPVLVGTVNVEVSEVLSRLLKRKKIEHSVLNAKYHEEEARIVAKAGERGAVTIATNMAGRGTDIKLGDGVVACEMCCYKCTDRDCAACAKEKDTSDECLKDMPCGLHIMGTERHESRRIDRQLRGRSGRQGDPGSSRFYLSLEDDLMRLFGSDRLSGVISKLGIQEGEAIEHSLITRQIGRAQKRVEANNFGIRKHLLEYDDVMNKQREVVYDKRLLSLESEDIGNEISSVIESVIDRKLETHIPGGSHPEDWDMDGFKRELETMFLWPFDLGGTAEPGARVENLADRVKNTAHLAYESRQREIGYETIKEIERNVLLYVIDRRWRDHLYDLDGVKSGIGLRAYGQKDPLLEYKAEAFELFLKMLDSIDEETVSLVFHGRWVKPDEEEARQAARYRAVKPEMATLGPGPQADPAAQPGPGSGVTSARGGQMSGRPVSRRKPVVAAPRVGRNDPCPCGSGKKHKKCCGR
ncbi:MAG: preprotein translocase subunit SecA [Candidatus Eisenbacteria bacterium]